MHCNILRNISGGIIIIICLLRFLITGLAAIIINVLLLTDLVVKLFCCLCTLINHPLDSLMVLLQLFKCIK